MPIRPVHEACERGTRQKGISMRRNDKSWMELDELLEPFLPAENAEAGAVVAVEFRNRLVKLEQQVLSQYTSMAAYATISKQDVEAVKVESRCRSRSFAGDGDRAWSRSCATKSTRGSTGSSAEPRTATCPMAVHLVWPTVEERLGRGDRCTAAVPAGEPGAAHAGGGAGRAPHAGAGLARQQRLGGGAVPALTVWCGVLLLHELDQRAEAALRVHEGHGGSPAARSWRCVDRRSRLPRPSPPARPRNR